ncbi:MAG: TlpA disulfide reductase family protein [Pedobacter sp.]
MSKSTRSLVIFAAILLIVNSFVYAQDPAKIRIPQKKIQKTSFTLNLQKIPGIGPSGNVSIGTGSFDPSNGDERTNGYPKIINEPTGLRNVVHYFYSLNDFQFNYQTYCAGTYSKDFFFDNARKREWNLADTLKLSRKAIKCGISLLAGYNTEKEIVYIIDKNGNLDFADDVLMPGLKRSRNYEEGAVEILTEYLYNQKIQQENILVRPIAENRTNNGTDKIDIAFAFPEFRYSRFTYQGQSYFVCADGVGLGGKNIFVMKDAPNFDPAKPEAKVALNQFIPTGNKDLRFTGYEKNGSEITLTVDNGNDLSLTPKSFSTQVGYLAPIIKGYNFLDSNKTNMPMISTADLKGKYVFVDFWSTYCGPCIAEFPYLKEVYQRYDRNKFEIIGVLEELDTAVTSRLSKEGNLVWPNIKTKTKGTEISGYKITSYPTSFLIDPMGKIIAMDLRGEALANKLKTLIK